MRRMVLAGLMMGLMVLGAAIAWAEPVLKIPVQLGEAEASVRQRLGEPSNVVDGNSGFFLWYEPRGVTVELDRETRTVIGVALMGEYRREGWSVYPGALTEGVDMSSTFDQVVRALGSSYQKDTLDEEMGVTESALYYWDYDTYSVSARFWQIDVSENGRIYPKGSLYSIDVTRNS